MSNSPLIAVPPALTADERTRLTRYEDTPDDAKTMDELLDELRLRGIRAERDKYREAALIRRMLPKDKSQTTERGDFTKVANAARYTREYVARIRDGKVALMNYAEPADA